MVARQSRIDFSSYKFRFEPILKQSVKIVLRKCAIVKGTSQIDPSKDIHVYQKVSISRKF